MLAFDAAFCTWLRGFISCESQKDPCDWFSDNVLYDDFNFLKQIEFYPLILSFCFEIKVKRQVKT